MGAQGEGDGKGGGLWLWGLNVHSCCRAWWVTAWALGSKPDMLLSICVALGKLTSEALFPHL